MEEQNTPEQPTEAPIESHSDAVQAVENLFNPVENEPEATEEPAEDVEATEEPAADEAEAIEEPEGPAFVEVEYDGQVYEVPENLKDALLRQSDYTSKTQEVAAQRKAAEVFHGELQTAKEKYDFAASIQDELFQAQQFEAQEKQLTQYLEANVTQMQSTEIEQVRIAIDKARRDRDNLVQSLNTRYTDFQQSQEQSHQELLNKGTEVLRQRIPGWGQEQRSQVRQYATDAGFTEAEIASVVDPRQVETLWKAAQYDALKAGAAPAVKAVAKAPTIKPKSSNPMPAETRKKLDLKNKLKSKSLSAKDKADLIAQDIGNRLA